MTLFLKNILFVLMLFCSLLWVSCDTKTKTKQGREGMSIVVYFEHGMVFSPDSSITKKNEFQDIDYITKMILSDSIIAKTLDRIYKKDPEANLNNIQSNLNILYNEEYTKIKIQLVGLESNFAAEFLVQLVGIVNTEMNLLSESAIENRKTGLAENAKSIMEMTEQKRKMVLELPEIESSAVVKNKLEEFLFNIIRTNAELFLYQELIRTDPPSISKDDFYLSLIADDNTNQLLSQYLVLLQKMEESDCYDSEEPDCMTLKTNYFDAAEKLKIKVGDRVSNRKMIHQGLYYPIKDLLNSLKEKDLFDVERDYEKKIKWYFELAKMYQDLKYYRPSMPCLSIMEQPYYEMEEVDN